MMPGLLARSPWRSARWLVIAPHPDDETLGAGALIHHAAAHDRLAGIVFLTDGGGSHPDGTERLRAVRRREAQRAVARLSLRPVAIDWLGWTDGAPFGTGTPPFHRTALRLAAIIRARRVDALAVSGPGDTHCDHVAASALAREAGVRSRRKVQIFAYSVWGDTAGKGARVRTPPMPVGLRRHALSAHRSQLSPLMGDGFRLPQHMRQMRAADLLVAMDGIR